MSKDDRKSTRRALERYYSKQAQRQKKEMQNKRRKNKAPEREAQKQVLRWLDAQGFSCQVIESKATYNEKAGRYMSGQTKAGTPDICGVTPNGIGCFIEMKAPGRRSSLRENQREFLTEKILIGCFAIVADGVQYVEEHYKAWLKSKNKRNYLLSLLPEEKDDITEDDADLPF